MKTEPQTPSAGEACAFFAEYAAVLTGCGATCIRLEKNVRRMAASYGYDIELAIMPRHIHISVWSQNHETAVTAISSVNAPGISFNINTRLSELSWEVADRKINFPQAKEKFKTIVETDKQNKWSILILVALANASFCRLFGGDPAAMAITGIATLAGYYIKQILTASKTDTRLTVFICSFISSILGASGILFSIGSTPDIALATGVLYLIPGIPFLNSFSDMLYRHYICAFSRFMDALVITCCLSAGLCAGMILMHTGMF